MAKTISFRLESDKIEALDALAALQDRPRTYLLHEAIENYLDLHDYHIQQIQEGIRDADAGKFVDHSEVKKLITQWRRKK